MGLTAKRINERVKTVTLEFAGDKMAYRYYPGRVDEEVLQGLVDAQTIKTQGAEGLVCLSRCLSGWDLPTSDDDPTPYPTTPEALAALAFDFRLELVISLISDYTEEKKDNKQ